MRLAYYTPSVVDGPNTTPYRHAKALGDELKETLLLTGRPPPDEIADVYQEVRILEGRGYAGVLSNIRQARRLVNRYLGPNGVLVTGVGHGPTLTGALSDATWVADVFDDPTQFIAENSESWTHRFLTPTVLKLLALARLAYVTQHPSSPLQSGKERVYGFNGAPVIDIVPGEKSPRPPLRVAVAGKVELRNGLDVALKGIAKADVPIRFDVFGKPYADSADYAKRLGISEQVNFHGWVESYDTVRDHVKRAHVGVCLWPERRDWDHSYPLKVGEYLAGGAIPLLTPRPGMTDLAGDVGVYCESATEVAQALERITTLSSSAFDQWTAAVRRRAETVPQQRDTRRFLAAIDAVFDGRSVR